MALSDERRESLRLLYESWGVDRVRAQLASEETNPLLPRDVVSYAWTWLAAEEVKRERILALCRRIVAVAFVLFAGALAALLIV